VNGVELRSRLSRSTGQGRRSFDGDRLVTQQPIEQQRPSWVPQQHFVDGSCDATRAPGLAPATIWGNKPVRPRPTVTPSVSSHRVVRQARNISSIVTFGATKGADCAKSPAFFPRTIVVNACLRAFSAHFQPPIDPLLKREARTDHAADVVREDRQSRDSMGYRCDAPGNVRLNIAASLSTIPITAVSAKPQRAQRPRRGAVGSPSRRLARHDRLPRSVRLYCQDRFAGTPRAPRCLR